MLANRISYTLGLTGPSFTLDTACSSSMYALDAAFNAIRSGECEAALVCGSNLLLHPYTTINFVKLGVLAKNGYCRPFDINSDGYTRAESICVIFVQKIKDANRAYAELVYSQTNCDGYKEEGITFPSSKMQTKLLTDFYRNINMDPTTVDYVEAHATGNLSIYVCSTTNIDIDFQFRRHPCWRSRRMFHIGQGVLSESGQAVASGLSEVQHRTFRSVGCPLFDYQSVAGV